MSSSVVNTEHFETVTNNLIADMLLGNLEPTKYVYTLACQEELYKHYFTYIERNILAKTNMCIHLVLNYAKFINNQDGITLKFYKSIPKRELVHVHLYNLREHRQLTIGSLPKMLKGDTRLSHYYKFERAITDQKVRNKMLSSGLGSFIDYGNFLGVDEIFIPWLELHRDRLPDKTRGGTYFQW